MDISNFRVAPQDTFYFFKINTLSFEAELADVVLAIAATSSVRLLLLVGMID